MRELPFPPVGAWQTVPARHRPNAGAAQRLPRACGRAPLAPAQNLSSARKGSACVAFPALRAGLDQQGAARLDPVAENETPPAARAQTEMTTLNLTMPVLTKETAENFLQKATFGKKRSEARRLTCLVAKLQAVQSHLALLSIFHKIWSLVEIARSVHPADGHRACNNFLKFICTTFGCHLAGVDRQTINGQIRTNGGVDSGTGVSKLFRKLTNKLWGDESAGGSVLWENNSGKATPTGAQLAQIGAAIAATSPFIELVQLVRLPPPSSFAIGSQP